MYFKKISMHGFKSFADPVTVEFDKGITCVVGPNGSGKSNISDALRWVLGEQSPKILRGGKMDEIIFAGTDKRKSRGMAEVTLVIDNSDHMLPIDFAEVSITRRMYRSGESEYYINDSQCRLKDIRELIMDTGIGVDGYSIIGQGKISEIISGKPDSRREIFEEAAGIVKYRTRKAETERKLAASNANLERVNDIVSELEVRVEPLRLESEKAREYLELSERYKETEINVTLKNIDQTRKNCEAYENDAAELDARISEAENKRTALERDIQSNKNRIQELDELDFQERDRILKYNDEMNELKNRVRLAGERITAQKANCTRLEEEKKELSDRLNRETSEKAELDARVHQLVVKSSNAESGLNDLREKLTSENNKYQDQTRQFNSDRDSIYELSLKSTELSSEISSLRQMGLVLENSRGQIMNAVPDDSDISIEADYKSAVRRKNSIAEEADAIKLQCSSAMERMNESVSGMETKARDLETARLRLNEEKTRRNMLLQLEDSYEGYNGAVRFIMKESGISGVFGTVGELINVPAGYELALETALGARMQNIVCRDDACADKAIRMLKSRRAGRLTFLPVESLRVASRKDASDISQLPGYIGVAADCITYEGDYRNAMEYLLGGIIIVKGLDDALAMSKKNHYFRFVTLDGEFINPAGAITGGAYKNNNNAGILERKNRLHQCEQHIHSYEKEVAEAENSLRKYREGREADEASLAKLQARQRELEIEVINAENEAKTLETRFNQVKDQADLRNRELDRLDNEIESNAISVKKLEAEKQDVDRRIEEMKQAAEKLSAENDEIRRALDELTEKLTSAHVEAESAKSEMNGVYDLIRRSEQIIKDLEADIVARTREEEASKAEQLTLQKEIDSVNNEIKLKEEDNTERTTAIRKIREEREDLNRIIDSLLQDKENQDKAIFGLRTSRHDIGNKLDAAAIKIENWKNSLWEEFEVSYLQAIELRKVTFSMSDGLKESKRLKNAIRALGDVNINAIAEYDTVKERYEFLTEQRADLNEAIASLRKIIEDTDIKIRASFKSSFNAISSNFESIFAELFGGGKAELHIDGDDPLESDIDIIVQPPGKKLQNMNLLSGGEKTLTAIALMFAVLRAKPTPFCILDEVEAALDEANIERFADYLRKFENIQFVLVTHQKVTMEHANVLYGVTMPEKGISKVLSLKLADAEKMEGIS